MQGLILLMQRCHSLTRPVWRKTQTRWLFESDRGSQLPSFPMYHIFRRKCKTQTQCEMTKGSGVFVLPPRITKWALSPSWSSKANIPFGFRENLGLDCGKRKCHPVWSRYRFTNVISMARRRDEVGWGWKDVSISNLFFSHLITVNFKDKACHKYPQMTKMQSSLSHTRCLSQVNFLTVILFGVHWDEISGYHDSGAVSMMMKRPQN